VSSRTDQQRRERILAKRAADRPEHTDKYSDRVMQEKLAALVAKFNDEEARRVLVLLPHAERPLGHLAVHRRLLATREVEE